MTCDEIKPLLAGYVDGQLSLIERQGVENHTEDCGRCREALQGQRSVQRILNQHGEEPLSPYTWQLVSAWVEDSLGMNGERKPAPQNTPTPQPKPEEPKPTPPRAPAPPRAQPPPAKPKAGRSHLKRRWVAHIFGIIIAGGLLLLCIYKVWDKLWP